MTILPRDVATVPTVFSAREAPPRSWKIATAVRAFAVAVAAGQVLGDGDRGSAGVTLLALTIVGIAMCVLELHTTGRRTPWASIAEAILVSVLVGAITGPIVPLLLCVVAPAVVAGIRYGLFAATNTWLTTVVMLLAADAAGPAGQLAGFDAAALPWLVAGLGAGLLAGSQTRSVRDLEATQAPYAAANRMVGQLNSLVRRLPMALDVRSNALRLQAVARTHLDSARVTVFVQGVDGRLELVAAEDGLDTDERKAADECAASGQPVQRPGILALPLRVGDHVFGAVVWSRWNRVSRKQLSQLQAHIDEQAIRLETALLIEDVRFIATSEERSRLARDIHDGIAQRVVALGYLADEIADTTDDPAALQVAGELRREVTRLVREVRFSVYDLRHEVSDADTLAGALCEYVHAIRKHVDLRVHLKVDERVAILSRRAADEMLRISQEAIVNVRRHANAQNIWVTLTEVNGEVRLVVEDDGTGGAAARAGHFGMHTMRERAERIGADLEVCERPAGGTRVTLRAHTKMDKLKEEIVDDDRLARR